MPKVAQDLLDGNAYYVLPTNRRGRATMHADSMTISSEEIVLSKDGEELVTLKFPSKLKRGDKITLQFEDIMTFITLKA
jgi:hypothetical protein